MHLVQGSKDIFKGSMLNSEGRSKEEMIEWTEETKSKKYVEMLKQGSVGNQSILSDQWPK